MSLQPLSRVEGANLIDTIDVRSWRVVARDGTPLGTVAEVILDVDAGRPAYLCVAPHNEPASANDEDPIRVPYRHVRVEESARRVVLSDLATLGFGTTIV